MMQRHEFKRNTSTLSSDVIATDRGYFDIMDPNPDEISLVDIACALSRIARFGGHGLHFYSVAAHSLFCEQIGEQLGMDKNARATLLMHDAAEAYVGDVVRPLKYSGRVGEYDEIEHTIWCAIAFKWGLPMITCKDIKAVDNIACITEKVALFPAHDDWPGFPDPLPRAPSYLAASMDTVFRAFVAKAIELGIK